MEKLFNHDEDNDNAGDEDDDQNQQQRSHVLKKPYRPETNLRREELSVNDQVEKFCQLTFTSPNDYEQDQNKDGA